MTAAPLAVQQLELFAGEATDPAERVVRHIGEHVEAFAEAAATGLDPDTTVTVTITAAGRSGSARGRGKKGTRRE